MNDSAVPLFQTPAFLFAFFQFQLLSPRGLILRLLEVCFVLQTQFLKGSIAELLLDLVPVFDQASAVQMVRGLPGALGYWIVFPRNEIGALLSRSLCNDTCRSVEILIVRDCGGHRNSVSVVISWDMVRCRHDLPQLFEGRHVGE
jgi:hypothetical protein